METVQKKKFCQLNDKRFPFLNGTENMVIREKRGVKKLEKEAKLKNHRLLTLQTIYDQIPQFRDLESNKRCHYDIENINFSLNTGRYLLTACY